MKGLTARFPNRLLIQPIAACPKLRSAPVMDGQLEEGARQLPFLGELEGAEAFADVFVGWWDGGLYVAAQVRKTGPIAINRQRPLQNDCVVVLVNTSPDASQRRPTHRCFQFIALPRGGGATRMEPVAWQEFFRLGPAQRLARRTELRVAASESRSGYLLELAIGSRALGDAELATGLVLGFECFINDTQQGAQTWSAPDDAPVFDIPSLWGLLQLTGAG
ncbi:MAG: hypothetical protein H5T86_04250 [Armatimonadetes bacterium]|nr:hypothetical protein [Armatimonadota bacterium]